MKKNIFLYGASSMGLMYLPTAAILYNVLGFIDGEPNKKGKKLAGLPIFHISELATLTFDLIVITSSYHKEISEKLKSLTQKSISYVCDCEDISTLHNELNQYRVKHRLDRLKNDIPLIDNISLDNELIKDCKLIVNRRMLLQLLPKNGEVAELGVAQGHFSKQILEISQPNTLHLVDVWASERYNEDNYMNLRNELSHHGEKIVWHRNLSTEAARDFLTHSLDWVYIDTDHSYLTTKQELLAYQHVIKPGGYICGHDYTMGNWAADYRYGVIEAVHEFCVSQRFRLVWLTMDLQEGQSFAIQKL
ncbi:class I SAM-dependent methyltransferase [Rheinheimera riviphila]|uniref:Class I SAM-dependent methyltransferase n=1 Tax=Rheinheimera riviphila TaxID=1834037 RepID=A0A437R3L4_9GAMM|nr:class I SAM-dependent methyltransferase [Rheinheimera riviphila]RVU41351.1 class I SAM-dependent methyltransferase [Rheinheimera riviphila]